MSEYQSISLELMETVYLSILFGHFSNLHFWLSISGWPQGYKSFLCSTQLSKKIIMLINVKMPTTFISKLNAISESLKARKSVFFSSSVFLSS